MKQGGKLFLAWPFFVAAMLFCYPNVRAEIQPPPVIINEVAWMGTASSSFAEWLELANTTASDVVLDGWSIRAAGWSKAVALSGTIKANDFFLLERTRDETLPDVAADQIYTGDLKNAGEKLELENAGGAVMDLLEATSGWPGGDNATKLTLERQADLSWASSTQAGGTPKHANSVAVLLVVPPVESTPTSTSVTPALPVNPAANAVPINLPRAISIYPGDIVINELMSDPLDGEAEWVELYLAADKTIDLAGATFEDGAQAKTVLNGKLSPSQRFLIIEKPNGNLNNSGDLLLLRDGNKSVVDQVAYGDWAGGQFNAPVARDGQALARRFDGINTYNAASDWAISKLPTRRAPNRIVSEAGDEPAAPVNVRALVISEILPDPLGDESGEFVEIYNQSAEAVVLAGWRLVTKSGQTYKFASTSVVGAHEYKTFFRSQTKLVLVNDNGSLKLLPPGSERASQSVSYKEVRAGQSFGRDAEGAWQWSQLPTPGAANKVSQINRPPNVSMYVMTPIELGQLAVFDSSDTFDAEGDSLSYAWQFGDGATSSLANPEHLFHKPGNFKVTLRVSDSHQSVTVTELIKVVAKSAKPPRPTFETKMSGLNSVMINEVLPNPAGSDESEFIELYNAGTERVSLYGWLIDDGPDGSNPYKINEEIIVEPKEYLLLERAETDLALNNNADEVRLFNGSGQAVDMTAYQKSAEGQVWARTPENVFTWSEVATPGTVNIIKSSELKVKSSAKRDMKSKIQNQNSKISESEVGDEAVFQCVVTSLPGQLASQYFYCENDRGWQIYNYKKDFPALSIDDLVEVHGVVAQTNGNWRLKIKARESVKKISEKTLAIPTISVEDLGAAHYGKLVRIAGEATKKSGSSFYLDDNTAEAVIQLKASAGLTTASISLGEIYEVVGVVQSSQSGLKILPRTREDLKRQRPEASLGEVATGTGTWLAAPSRAKGYAVAAGSGTALLFGLWVMRKVGVKF